VGYVDVALWGVLPAVLRAFRERHPGVSLTMHERLPAQQLTGLRGGDLDVGIGPPPPVRLFETAPVSDEPLLVAVPATHRLAGRAAVEIGELADEPWVLVPRRVPSRLGDLVRAACASAGFTPRVAQEARQLDALVALVSAGLGVTLVPSAAERVPRPGVAYRPLRGPALRFPLTAAWRRDDAPPTAASFLAVLREVTARDAAGGAG
jgi:DNA-binding transcriptional LysR family regulator